MALPTLTYDGYWRFKVNQDLNNPGTGIACFRQLIRSIKTSLITSASWTDSANAADTVTVPWTVVASSDSVSASASDLWDADTDLVWAVAGSAHSWIVLRQTGIHGSNFELCIDLNVVNTSYHQISVIVSWEGFSTGSPLTTARPTASDEKILLSQASWVTTSATTFDAMLHVLMTDGGECSRIIVCTAGAVQSHWSFDKPKTPVDNWTNPAVAFAIGRASTTAALFYSARNVWFNNSSTNMSCYLTCDTHAGAGSLTRLTTINDLTSEWPMWPQKIYYDSPIAEYPDMWWGSTGPGDGDTYPASGTTKQFVQFSDMIQPWNQTTPLLT